MRVFLTELCSVTQQELKRLAATLPADRLAQATRRDGSLDAQRVIGFCLVRYAVAQIAPTADAEHWQRDENGKPKLSNAPLHFNLTHTPDAVAVVIATHEVGVDLEQIRPHPPRFVKRYFDENEQAQIASAPDGDGELCRLWTTKEAAGKRCGKGLSDGVRCINTADTQSLSLTLNGKAYWLSVSPKSASPLQIEPISVGALS